jgi:hypothetical protein
MPIHIEDIDLDVEVVAPQPQGTDDPVEPTLQRQRQDAERLRGLAEQAARTAAWGFED